MTILSLRPLGVLAFLAIATLGVLAFLAIATLVPAIARADAVSDQKRAYDALGIEVPHPAAMCRLVTKDEATRALGTPVGDGESGGSVAGCAYRAVSDPSRGVLVVRQARKGWYAPTQSPQYRAIDGLGERAYTALEPGIGFKAGVLAPSGVTNVQLSGGGTAADALALLKIAMKR